MKTYRIDRSKWVCGGVRFPRDIVGTSKLLNSKDRMCCLGQVCQQSGVPESKLSPAASPGNIEYDVTNVPRWLLDRNKYNSYVCGRMMSANDDSYINQREREAKLKKLAAPHCKLVFFGKLGVREPTNQGATT